MQNTHNKGNDWVKYVESGFDEKYKAKKAVVVRRKIMTPRGLIERTYSIANRQRRGVGIQETK